jgi:hypothetical protein
MLSSLEAQKYGITFLTLCSALKLLHETKTIYRTNS